MSWWRAGLAAIGLLTRLPVTHGALEPQDLRRSVLFYPWVGGGLGALWLVLSMPWVVDRLGSATTAATMLCAMVLVTGGLHVDGLADFGDGYFGGRGDRERTLAIMRDSRIGAHGASLLVLVLLLAHSAMTRQLDRAMPAQQWLLAPMLARSAVAACAALVPPARADGLAHSLQNPRSASLAWLSALPTILAVAVLAPHTWPAAICATAIGAVPQAWALRVLRGTTGDVHGTTILLAEATYLALA